MTMTATKDDLAMFGPGAGELTTQPSLFDDFWGVITGFSFTDVEQAKWRDGKKTDETWIIPVLRMHLLMDNGRTYDEDFTLPHDKETGVLLRDDNGNMKRPDKNSKWGRFESILVTNDLEFEHPNDLIGLHAHFVKRTVNTEGRNPFPVNGRYITEFDGYNNEIRTAAKLPARTVEARKMVFPVEATSPADNANQALKALEIYPDKTRVDIMAALVRAGLPVTFGAPEYLSKLVADGVLAMTGNKYVRGENYPN